MNQNKIDLIQQELEDLTWLLSTEQQESIDARLNEDW